MTENEIGKQIVGSAVQIHRELGPGLLETVYENILAQELHQRGLGVERQIPIAIEYQELKFDEGFRADLIVRKGRTQMSQVAVSSRLAAMRCRAVLLTFDLLRSACPRVYAVGLLLLLIAPELLAQTCFSQAPSMQGGQDFYQAITSTRLSKEDEKIIEKLFKKVSGRWAGDAEGFFCRGKEATSREEADRYRSIALQATTDGPDELLIWSVLNSKDGRTNRTETLRLFVSDKSLRVHRNNGAGQVKIMGMSRSGDVIEFLEKGRPSGAGGAGFIEILRKIKVSATTLTIVVEVYAKDGLTSRSTWKLRKK